MASLIDGKAIASDLRAQLSADVASLVTNRDISAGGRRHAIAVDTAHRLHDLVARMDHRSANSRGGCFLGHLARPYSGPKI